MAEEAKPFFFFFDCIELYIAKSSHKGLLLPTKEKSNLPEVTEFGTSCWSILVSEPTAVPPNAEAAPLSEEGEAGRGSETAAFRTGRLGTGCSGCLPREMILSSSWKS